MLNKEQTTMKDLGMMIEQDEIHLLQSAEGSESGVPL